MYRVVPEFNLDGEVHYLVVKRASQPTLHGCLFFCGFVADCETWSQHKADAKPFQFMTSAIMQALLFDNPVFEKETPP